MQIVPSYSFATFSALAAKSCARASCPVEPGPDDVYDPDSQGRDNHGGPDDTSDPDSYGGGYGDSYSGPDGPIDSGPYC